MPPYLPFLEAFGRHIQLTPLDLLRTQVTAAPQVLATLLPELITRLGDLPASQPLPPEQARFRLYEAIGAFLEVMGAPHAMVLILDDLQWADTASLDLLCHLARHQSNAHLLVLGAYRECEIERNPVLARTLAELTTHGQAAVEAARAGGLVWISYPKGGKSELKRDLLWDAVPGWRPVTQIAVDETWSAMRFRPAAEIGT